jgi:dimethylaniline monooxygenase (N-oxide forming)
MRTDAKYCVIGAGAAGLAAAKTFKQRGIEFDCLERAQDLGGLWNAATSSGIVYDSTHLVSASWTSGFDDFPMPEINYPDYPSATLVLQYFRDYAHHFDILQHIQFSTAVERVTANADGTWDVAVANETMPRRYKGVVVANGHHNVPRLPTYPGRFDGRIMHSRDYKTNAQVRDQRVLIVGAGNSACDIVRDAAHASTAKVTLSMRRGTWFVPKYLLGFPTGDVINTAEFLPLPRIIKRYLFQATLWVLQGPPERYGLPKPTHAIDAAHPTMSDEIPRLSAHGRISVRPEISHYDGPEVVFKDGQRETFDLIVFATGYQIVMPFLDDNTVFDEAGRSRLFLNVAHPAHNTLFFTGLVQANGSIWRLADYQSRLIANAIIATDHAPNEAQAFWSRVRNSRPGLPKLSVVASDRHTLEANFFDYRRILLAEIKRFRTAGGMVVEHDPVDVAAQYPGTSQHHRANLSVAAE